MLVKCMETNFSLPDELYSYKHSRHAVALSGTTISRRDVHDRGPPLWYSFISAVQKFPVLVDGVLKDLASLASHPFSHKPDKPGKLQHNRVVQLLGSRLLLDESVHNGLRKPNVVKVFLQATDVADGLENVFN